MTQHLHRAMAKLKEQVLTLGGIVEHNIAQALQAFETLDAATAREIIASDKRVDLMEVEVEEESLKLLALHQPVAMDLRFIVSVLKINSDLERIGDYAVNIGWRVVELAERGASPSLFDVSLMAQTAREMLHDSLRSLVNVDVGLARTVLQRDDVVDAENRRLHGEALASMRRSPDDIEVWSALLSLGRALERIADHATNIAEDVIYMVDGDIVRHGRALHN